MSDKRKIGPVRQMSLQSENHRIRPILKKQLSVEQLDRIQEPRIESAKNKLMDRPRPIKVAWAEEQQQQLKKFNDTVDVKKCKEHKRPSTAKLRTQNSVEKESILYTRQELAERLRKAWKEREDNKQNLDIFLTPHQNDKHFDDLENENYYPDYKEDKPNIDEEIIAQFKPTKFINQHCINKNKVTKNQDLNEFNYIPSTTLSRPQDVRTITNISVTIPSVNSLIKPIQEDPPDSPPHSLDIKPEIPNPPPTRPHTASASTKRESFQKRTNTAFTGSINITGTTIPEKPQPRPPLIRAVSVPSRPTENNKLKFIATKRRLKSARKRNNSANNTDNPEDQDDKVNKKGNRCKSAPNADVVTMVSLISPAGSDNEDVPEVVKKETKGRNLSPVKQTSIESVNKSIALRKSVKSVSFQQSSIHAVRSFSASFPARRGILTSSASISLPEKEREKRAPMETTDFRGPKRRLVKSFSVAGDDDVNQRINTAQNSFEETFDPDKTKILVNQSSEEEVDEKVHNDEQKNDEPEEPEEPFDPNMPKFETNKEKECWIMYKKMSDKGLPVSFDTILRGMLTPTEYRSVRKEIQTT